MAWEMALTTSRREEDILRTPFLETAQRARACLTEPDILSVLLYIHKSALQKNLSWLFVQNQNSY